MNNVRPYDVNRAILFVLFCLSSLSLGAPLEGLEVLKKSIEQQSTFFSLRMKVKQVKTLPSLRAPVIDSGSLLVLPKKAFRWEMGNPLAQTTIYDGRQIVVLNELKNTGKVLDPEDRKIKPILLMFGMGEGSSFEGFMKLFRVEEVIQEKAVTTFVLRPKKGAMRRGIKQLKVSIERKSYLLSRLTWIQKDDSVVTTFYSRIQTNVKISPDVLKFDVSAYQWE